MLKADIKLNPLTPKPAKTGQITSSIASTKLTFMIQLQFPVFLLVIRSFHYLLGIYSLIKNLLILQEHK